MARWMGREGDEGGRKSRGEMVADQIGSLGVGRANEWISECINGSDDRFLEELLTKFVLLITRLVLLVIQLELILLATRFSFGYSVGIDFVSYSVAFVSYSFSFG